MLHSLENEFVRVCRESGLLTEEQIAEAIDIKKKMSDLGVKPKDIAVILLDKEYISQQDCHAVIEQVKKSAPRRIAGFEILERLSHGAMGIVYKARQVSMDRIVAVKVLSKELKHQSYHVERFKREARAVAQLDHKNIVGGIDVGEENGVFYFAMEFVEGKSLQTYINEKGWLPEPEALEITLQIARALDYANDKGIIHRDIKPDNILIDLEGVPKLCDLGLARVENLDDSSLTIEGTSMGTPDYISPEQAKGSTDLDIRTDIYSLGVALFHMLTGQTPFSGDNAMVIMTKHLTDRVPSVREISPDLRPQTEAIVRRMTQREREGRYSCPKELIEELEAALDPETSATMVDRSFHGPPPEPVEAPRAHSSAVLPRPGSGVRAIEPVPNTGRVVALVCTGIGALVVTFGIGFWMLTGMTKEAPPAEESPMEVGSQPPKDTQPVVTAEPEVPKAQPAPDEVAFAKIEEVLESATGDHCSVIKQCEEFLSSFPESDRLVLVETLLAKRQEELESDLRARLEPALAEVAKLESAGQLWQAAERLEEAIPQDCDCSPRIQSLRDQVAALRTQEETGRRRDLKAIEIAESRGRLGMALEVIERMRNYANPERVAHLSQIEDRIRSQLRSRRRDREREVVLDLWSKLEFGPVPSWNLSAAREVVDSNVGMSLNSDLKQSIVSDLDSLAEFPALVAKGLKGMRLARQQLEYSGTEWTIRDVKSDSVELSAGSARMTIPFERFSPSTLFGRILARAKPHEIELPKLVYLLKSSERKLEQEKLGLVPYYLDQAEGHLGKTKNNPWELVLAELRAQYEEQHARQLYAEAMAEAQDEENLVVSPLAKFRYLLEQYSDSQVVNRHRAEIEERVRQLTDR